MENVPRTHVRAHAQYRCICACTLKTQELIGSNAATKLNFEIPAHVLARHAITNCTMSMYAHEKYSHEAKVNTGQCMLYVRTYPWGSRCAMPGCSRRPGNASGRLPPAPRRASRHTDGICTCAWPATPSARSTVATAAARSPARSMAGRGVARRVPGLPRGAMGREMRLVAGRRPNQWDGDGQREKFPQPFARASPPKYLETRILGG